MDLDLRAEALADGQCALVGGGLAAVADRSGGKLAALPSRSLSVINCVARAHMGGTSWRVVVVAQALRSIGANTTVLLPEDKDPAFQQFLEDQGVPYVECRLRAAGRIGRWRNNLRYVAGLPGQILRLTSIFRARAPDLVHVNGASNLAPLIAAILCGHPVLWHWNDMLVPRPFAAILLLFCIMPRVHCVVASEPVADHYRIQRIGPHYLGVLPPPLPPKILTPHPAEPLPDLPHGRKILGFVSNLLETKGTIEFIETIALLRQRGVMVTGVMVGGTLSGHEAFHEKVRRRIAELQLGEQIVLTGYRNDVTALMVQFDALLYPSHTEAAPIAIIQAMATGVPIVATDVGDIPNMLKGLGMPIVSVGDVPAMATAVQRLLDIPSTQRADYRRTAADKVERGFSLAVVAARHLALYGTVTKRPEAGLDASIDAL